MDVDGGPPRGAPTYLEFICFFLEIKAFRLEPRPSIHATAICSPGSPDLPLISDCMVLRSICPAASATEPIAYVAHAPMCRRARRGNNKQKNCDDPSQGSTPWTPSVCSNETRGTGSRAVFGPVSFLLAGSTLLIQLVIICAGNWARGGTDGSGST